MKPLTAEVLEILLFQCCALAKSSMDRTARGHEYVAL